MSPKKPVAKKDVRPARLPRKTNAQLQQEVEALVKERDGLLSAREVQAQQHDAAAEQDRRVLRGRLDDLASRIEAFSGQLGRREAQLRVALDALTEIAHSSGLRSPRRRSVARAKAALATLEEMATDAR